MFERQITRRNQLRRALQHLVVAIAVSGLTFSSVIDDNFYAGKTLRILVVIDAGGGLTLPPGIAEKFTQAILR